MATLKHELTADAVVISLPEGCRTVTIKANKDNAGDALIMHPVITGGDWVQLEPGDEFVMGLESLAQTGSKGLGSYQAKLEGAGAATIYTRPNVCWL